MVDLAAVKNMSLEDFSLRSVLLADVSTDTFDTIKEWCSTTYENHSDINVTARQTRHEVWAVRASFVGDDAVKNAALFRMFWG